MQQVSDHVFVETSFRGCNPGIVVVPDGVVMIDTPMLPSQAMAWRDFVLSKGAPLYLIHTEAHFDHLVGDYLFPRAVMICHEDIIEQLPKTPEAFLPVKERIAAIDGASPIERYDLRPHHITFRSDLKLRLGSLTLELINLPGHTDQETVVVIPEERVAFTGDNIFHRCQAYLQDGSPWRWLESLERIADLDVDVLVPGHGGVCDRSYIPEMAGFIREWIDTVQDAVDRGVSREEALASISLAHRYPVEHNHQQLAPMIQQWNVANIYDRIVSGRR